MASPASRVNRSRTNPVHVSAGAGWVGHRANRAAFPASNPRQRQFAIAEGGHFIRDPDKAHQLALVDTPASPRRGLRSSSAEDAGARRFRVRALQRRFG